MINPKDNSPEMAFCLTEYEDLRDEIKQRISQRDRYFSQMLIATAGILSFGLLGMGDARSYAILFAPPVALAYTALIQYSYKIHGDLTTYLRAEVAVKSRSLCTDSNSTENDPTKWTASEWKGKINHGLNWEIYCAYIRSIAPAGNRQADISPAGIRQDIVLPFMAGIIAVSLVLALIFLLFLLKKVSWWYNLPIIIAFFVAYWRLGIRVYQINPYPINWRRWIPL